MKPIFCWRKQGKHDFPDASKDYGENQSRIKRKEPTERVLGREKSTYKDLRDRMLTRSWHSKKAHMTAARVQRRKWEEISSDRVCSARWRALKSSLQNNIIIWLMLWKDYSCSVWSIHYKEAGSVTGMTRNSCKSPSEDLWWIGKGSSEWKLYSWWSDCSSHMSKKELK